MRKARFWLAYSAALLVVTACVAAPSCESPDPIVRALDYLEARQVKELTLLESPTGGIMVDVAGNWPQEVYVDFLPHWRYREVNPFMAAFIHHSLTYVREENLSALRVPADTAERARRMRERAIEFMRSFEAPLGEADAGTFGFWPYASEANTETAPFQNLALLMFGGPCLYGPRMPVNISMYPSQMGVPGDADDTANIYVAILDDALYDGGPGTLSAFERFFADWRDLGQSERRIDPPWLPDRCGAFLTWLHYDDVPAYSVYNDIDAVVNANVLHTLGRYGRLDTPGVAESVALINFIVETGLHRTNFPEAADYYPDNLAFYYCVSRAYHDGGVTALRPAVDLLADELEAEATVDVPGSVYWDRGEPDLNTAFAMLTLMNAGRDTRLIEQGAAYLASTQNPFTGSWREAVFFLGRTDSGPIVSWSSPSLTTAFALEALCRHRLYAAPE